MKYTKIKSDKHYNIYCEIHEQLTFKDYNANKDEIKLIEILIDEYENRTLESPKEMDSVETIEYLLLENQLSKAQLARELNVSRQLVSDILNYRRSISKSMILKLSDRFKMQAVAFSKAYSLKGVKAKKQLA